MIGSAEVHRPWPELDLVGREAQIADDEFVLRVLSVEPGFEMTVVLESLSQRIADQADVIPFFDFQSGDWFRIGGTGC
jgi:hypothetical protein